MTDEKKLYTCRTCYSRRFHKLAPVWQVTPCVMHVEKGETTEPPVAKFTGEPEVEGPMEHMPVLMICDRCGRSVPGWDEN